MASKKRSGKNTKKATIGLTEKVNVIGPEKERELIGRIDTGADICSIDIKLAKRVGLDKIEKLKKIKSAHGIKHRPVVRGKLEMVGKKFNKVRFTLADRKHLRYKVLIGKNILKRGFLIDPNR